MKCDGHAKITNAALKQLVLQCKSNRSIAQSMCSLPDFNTGDRSASFNSKSDSITSDNWETAVGIFLSQFNPFDIPDLNNFAGYLTTRTVAIDVDLVYLKNHITDWGQRLHFLRASSETVTSAYNNGCQFIRLNAAKWVEITLRIKLDSKSVINGSLRKKAIEHLALALHCLQDTFSPSHTDRSASKDPNKPGKITNISIYEQQNKHDHSVEDYKSGSINSIYGRTAINASTALLLICIQAVASSSYLIRGWDNFKVQWLGFNPTAK